MAIVNTERLERYAAIPEEERRMAEALLFNHPLVAGETDDETLIDAPQDWRQQSPEQRAAIHQHHIARISDHFRGAKRQAVVRPEQPLDERLAGYIVDGSRSGLREDLDLKLAESLAPLDIINGPLMAGMAEVGRLFNANELIVAEVLQSAEAMKAAVSHLEQFMDAETSAARGRVVLATVKGDVHDIGKNLVEIILTNNGFEIIDLGIKVVPETLVQAVREHRPDAIGLSGLLVKSAQQMVVTAGDLAAADIDLPILVGGAALSKRFTDDRIAPTYGGSRDLLRLMRWLGLATMLRLSRGGLGREARPRGSPSVKNRPPARAERRATAALEPESIACRARPHRADDRRFAATARGAVGVVSNGRSAGDLVVYVNPKMLYGKHLGLRGSFAQAPR